MDITVNAEGAKAQIQVAGKLTVQTSPDLESVISGLSSEVCDLDIDLSGVEYISSAGLRVLVAADKLATSRGGSMRLLHPNSEVYDVFDMTGLIDVFTIVK